MAIGHAFSSKSSIFHVAYLEEMKPQIQITNRNACHTSLNLNWIELNQMIPVYFVRACTIHVLLILSLCLSPSSSSSSSPVCVQSVNEALLSDFWFTISTELYTFFFFLRSPTSVNFIYLCMSYTHKHTSTRTRMYWVFWYVNVGWNTHMKIHKWSESPVDKFRQILFVLLQLCSIVGALRLQFNLHTSKNSMQC